MKFLRDEITSHLVEEHQSILKQNDKLCDKLLGNMCVESTESGEKLAKRKQ